MVCVQFAVKLVAVVCALQPHGYFLGLRPHHNTLYLSTKTCEH